MSQHYKEHRKMLDEAWAELSLKLAEAQKAHDDISKPAIANYLNEVERIMRLYPEFDAREGK